MAEATRISKLRQLFLARVTAGRFFTELASGALPRASYVMFLRALAVVYRAAEATVVGSTDPRVKGWFEPIQGVVPALEAELARHAEEPSAGHPLLVAELLVLEVRRSARADADALAGVLAALSDPTFGGLVSAARLSRAFGPGAGAAFELGARAEGASALDVEGVSAERAARAILDGLERLIATLAPLDTTPLELLVTTLNSEAGRHLIAPDLRELAAAFRAGERSLEHFPYLDLRYRERGRAFTWSDSAWLANLARSELSVVRSQVMWLGRILASRGMPRIVLELHLDLLAEELVRAVPERAADYRSFSEVAAELRRERFQFVAPSAWAELEAAFERDLAAALGGQAAALANTGSLLLAAVCDRRAGIANAVASLEGWFTTAPGLALGLAEVVHRTLARAEARAAAP